MRNKRKSFNKERQFAKKLSNIFLNQKSVKVKSGNLNIAYVNVKKKMIFFDFPKIFQDENMFKEMMTFKGLLFHEIHHIKYTVNSKRFKDLDRNLKNLIQLLEDGRIETLGVLKYEKLADYFIYSVNNVLLEDKNNFIENKDNKIVNAYILSYGRKIFWQNKELLYKIREICISNYGTKLVEKLEDYIDEYIFEKSTNKRIDIAIKIFYLLYDKNASPNYRSMENNKSDIDSGRSDPKTMTQSLREIADILKKAKKHNQKIVIEIREKTKDAKDNSKEREEHRKKLEKDLIDVQKQIYDLVDEIQDATTEEEYDRAQNEKLKKEVEKDFLKIKLATGTGFSPKGHSEKTLELKDLVDGIEDEQEELIQDNETDLLEDLKSTGRALDDVYADSSFNVTDDMRKNSKELEKGLKKLNTELVKGYIRKQKQGRVDIRSAMNRRKRTDTRIFKRYLPNKIKQTKLLVNIFLDGSGSMAYKQRWEKSLKAIWVINDAMNKDENKIMAYQFAVDYIKFKDYDEPLSIPQLIGGGTYPAPAILESIQHINKYQKLNNYHNVVDIIITDGDFSREDNDDAIQKLNDLGHETILIKVKGYDYSKEKHKAKHYIHLVEFEDLVPKLTEIFTKIKKSLIRRVI